MKCPNCHSENPDTSRFCSHCATQLPSSEEIDLPHSTHKKPGKELAKGASFAKRYEIIEELGEGGMGKAYRAVDNKINEEVALKILRPEIAADKKHIERFSNELKIARKISHKNICRMYHLGEESGTHYITMEYIPGQNLGSIIKMTKQLSVGTAIRITKQVGEGLAEAHRLGVVHRDLKPGNIMIDKEGNARIMDFGIARSLEAQGITGAGAMIGTPEYMSPEQVEGKEADKRSDIYALGVILYEMLTGKLPFEGKTPLSIAMKHKSEIPLNPRKFNAQIPEDLSRVILKCMEKDKEKRYQSAEALSSELDNIEKGISLTEGISHEKRPITTRERKKINRKPWLIIAALLILAVLIRFGIQFIKRGKSIPSPSSRLTMLAVLPFVNLGLPEDEYFADGLTEELTSRLSAVHRLGIISRTSAKKYKQSDKTVKQIGEELDVDYVLEGSVRWDRRADGIGRVRITPQLIRVSDDTHLWAESYDRVIEDIFSVQSEITEHVIKKLDLTVMGPERKALYKQPTDNLEAYDYYLRSGKHASQGGENLDPEEYEKAVELCEKAIALDPDFTLAHINLSVIHLMTYGSGIDRTSERLAKSKAAIDKALQLEPDLPSAKLSLALYYYWGFQDYDRALEEFEAVQRAWPNYTSPYIGYIQRRQGKWKESVKNVEKAFKLRPRDVSMATQLGISYLALRRYKEAEDWFNRSLSIDPNSFSAQLSMADVAFLSEADTKEARTILETLPRNRFTDYNWLTLYMLERKFDEALDHLASLPYDSFYYSAFYFHKDLAYASIYYAQKELSKMKIHANKAVIVIGEVLKENLTDPRLHAALGLTYAYLGRKQEAIREGNRAAELYPESRDAVEGRFYVHNRAIIYILVGEYDKAISELEYLLSIPSGDFISAPLLRVDPTWDPLRDHPRFKQLLDEYAYLSKAHPYI